VSTHIQEKEEFKGQTEIAALEKGGHSLSRFRYALVFCHHQSLSVIKKCLYCSTICINVFRYAS